LKKILPRDPLLIYSEHRLDHGKRQFAQAQKAGHEGIMAKRASGRYLSGTRTKDWLKIKTGKRQEVVIVGFTAPRRSRPHFGALVLAVRKDKHWRYVGHVGTGFSHAALKSIYDKLSRLRAPASPFKQKVKDEANTTWVKPKLVAEVKFTEWTDAGEMRHPAFLGLREDKRAEDVVAKGRQFPSAAERLYGRDANRPLAYHLWLDPCGARPLVAADRQDRPWPRPRRRRHRSREFPPVSSNSDLAPC
jgi:bifunctional non-homologous end joining protein LigD